MRLPSVADTERLGAALASSAPWSANRALITYLQGELGSGKTTLARALLRRLGVTETVRSPTYTLLECYEPAGKRFLHVDLYRLGEAAELESLGLRDELEGAALLLIEWPERALQDLPPPDLRISLGLAQTGRSARLAAESQEGRDWLAGIQGHLKS